MDSPAKLVKEKLNIADVVSQYVQLKKAGKNLTGKCPFHKERTPSFFVSPERGTYICFGCGEKGDVFSFVERMDGIDFKAALTQLAERAGVKLPKYTPPKPGEKEKEDRLREVCEAAVAFFEAELLKRADIQTYLAERGVKSDTARAWRLGYAPATWESLCRHLMPAGLKKEDIVDAGFGIRSEKKEGELFDRFRGRIIFPIFDAAGAPIAVSGRFFEKVPAKTSGVAGRSPDASQGNAFGGAPAKYINSPETALFKKSNVLYGFDKARAAIRKADCILLVEGQFDLVMAHQSGLPFAVALSGTALTPEHLALLGRLSKRLVLALDADAAGLRSGLKSAHMALAAGFDVKIPAFPDGKDPADIAAEDPEKLRAAVRASRTAVEFFLEALRRALPAGRQGDERAYKKLVEAQVLPLIAAIGSRIEQEHFIKLVAETLRISEESVRFEVSKASAQSTTIYDSVSMNDVATPDSPPYSAIESGTAMLLFHFPAGSDVRARLQALLGKPALEDIAARLKDDTERLCFEFDRLGEDEASTADGLLGAIERELLEADIHAAREALRAAEAQGDAAKAAALVKKLSGLSRRRQEIRG